MKPTAPQGRLVRQWQGHTVEVSERGLAIDGRTVDPTPLAAEDALRPADDVRTHPSLQFLPGGALVYRGHVQAEVHPQEVTVHGPTGTLWPPEQQHDPPAPQPPAPEVDDDFDIDL
ncbi:hypothetical protein ACFY12_34265 [Streptomyces sp. NPDC001339]|uniref:hypothetical protein n=1 Tax=Streptomyces sp. NPDC001339 TaxID=3364563 RepID=UPI003688D027